MIDQVCYETLIMTAMLQGKCDFVLFCFLSQDIMTKITFFLQYPIQYLRL